MYVQYKLWLWGIQDFHKQTYRQLISDLEARRIEVVHVYATIEIKSLGLKPNSLSIPSFQILQKALLPKFYRT